MKKLNLCICFCLKILKDPKILSWLGKFINESFEIRTSGRIGNGLTSIT